MRGPAAGLGSLTAAEAEATCKDTGNGGLGTILLDAFDSKGETPAHLLQSAFLTDCYSALAPGGTLVTNLFNGPLLPLPSHTPLLRPEAHRVLSQCLHASSSQSPQVRRALRHAKASPNLPLNSADVDLNSSTHWGWDARSAAHSTTLGMIVASTSASRPLTIARVPCAPPAGGDAGDEPGACCSKGEPDEPCGRMAPPQTRST